VTVPEGIPANEVTVDKNTSVVSLPYVTLDGDRLSPVVVAAPVTVSPTAAVPLDDLRSVSPAYVADTL
jgi:hypothetical protein